MTEKTFRGLGPVEFEGVRGVGTMQVDFEPGQQVYALIGENGVGKTKFLECLFKTLHLNEYKQEKYLIYERTTQKTLKILGIENIESSLEPVELSFIINIYNLGINLYTSSIPSVYLGDYERNIINHRINKWLIQQKKLDRQDEERENNYKVIIKVLLKLLNQIYERIDLDFFEIDDTNNAIIKINEKKCQLSELSSGFISALKIILSIIIGYDDLTTNAEDLEQVQGIVLIDEIESHLHTSWQLKILPLLKRLFPNTTFVVSTHSPIVISSLAEGEVYRLQYHTGGVVRGRKIPRLNQMALVDLLQEVFGVSINEIRLNRLKLEQLAKNGQKKAKEELAKLVEEELNLLGKE